MAPLSAKETLIVAGVTSLVWSLGIGMVKLYKHFFKEVADPAGAGTTNRNEILFRKFSL